MIWNWAGPLNNPRVLIVPYCKLSELLNLGEIISFTVVANSNSRRVMEKIGLHHSETDDFDHPNLDENSPLRRHVLYRITRDNYLRNTE